MTYGYASRIRNAHGRVLRAFSWDHTADVIAMVVHRRKVMGGDRDCPIRVKLRASAIGLIRSRKFNPQIRVCTVGCLNKLKGHMMPNSDIQCRELSRRDGEIYMPRSSGKLEYLILLSLGVVFPPVLNCPNATGRPSNKHRRLAPSVT